MSGSLYKKLDSFHCSENAMIKSSLEKFDTPVVIINQVFEGEDWGVVASYVSKQDILTEAGGEESLFDVGWHLSITRPDLDDVDFSQIFSTPEAALEFGIRQILSGALTPVSASSVNPLKGDDHPFGHYHSVASPS